MDFIRFLENVMSHCSCVIMTPRFPRFASLNDSVKYYFFSSKNIPDVNTKLCVVSRHHVTPDNHYSFAR